MSDDLHPEHELDPDTLAALEADLSSAALWAEPPTSLEDDLVAAIAADVAAEAGPAPAVQPARRWLWAVAAIAFLAGGFALGAVVTGDDDSGTEIVGEVFALDGTELAAEADADVELAVLLNGLRIILAVDELPPAPDGTFYEAWLVDGQAYVSAGTFHMRNQTGRIELWAGVTPSDYPTFLVTLEADDGDPTASGDVVFEADVSSLADS